MICFIVIISSQKCKIISFNLYNSKKQNEEVYHRGIVVFENMEINNAIELKFNEDWSDDRSLVLRLLQPSNNGRLGVIRETTLQVMNTRIQIVHYFQMSTNLINCRVYMIVLIYDSN